MLDVEVALLFLGGAGLKRELIINEVLYWLFIVCLIEVAVQNHHIEVVSLIKESINLFLRLAHYIRCRAVRAGIDPKLNKSKSIGEVISFKGNVLIRETLETFHTTISCFGPVGVVQKLLITVFDLQLNLTIRSVDIPISIFIFFSRFYFSHLILSYVGSE